MGPKYTYATYAWWLHDILSRSRNRPLVAKLVFMVFFQVLCHSESQKIRCFDSPFWESFVTLDCHFGKLNEIFLGTMAFQSFFYKKKSHWNAVRGPLILTLSKFNQPRDRNLSESSHPHVVENGEKEKKAGKGPQISHTSGLVFPTVSKKKKKTYFCISSAAQNLFYFTILFWKVVECNLKLMFF